MPRLATFLRNKLGIVAFGIAAFPACAEGTHTHAVRQRAVSDLPCNWSEIQIHDLEGNDRRFVARGCGKKIEYEWKDKHLQSTTAVMPDPGH